MGIQKIVKLASSVLTKVQKMPLQHKVGLAMAAGGGLFGAGVLTGYALFGDRFVKQNAEEKAQIPADVAQENVQEPKAEQKFKYEPPKVGMRGIVSADTCYSEKTGKPNAIFYNDANGAWVHMTSLNENNGAVEGFSTQSSSDRGYVICDYLANGTLKSREIGYEDGSSERTAFLSNGCKHEYRYDKEGRLLFRKYIDLNSHYIDERTREYNDVNGTYVEKSEYLAKNGNYENIHKYYDKNDRVIKEKHFNCDEQLSFTVTPKYDRDGDIVKRDTTWVNK